MSYILANFSGDSAPNIYALYIFSLRIEVNALTYGITKRKPMRELRWSGRRLRRTDTLQLYS